MHRQPPSFAKKLQSLQLNSNEAPDPSDPKHEQFKQPEITQICSLLEINEYNGNTHRRFIIGTGRLPLLRSPSQQQDRTRYFCEKINRAKIDRPSSDSDPKRKL